VISWFQRLLSNASCTAMLWERDDLTVRYMLEEVGMARLTTLF
jgi:hypothetical protein